MINCNKNFYPVASKLHFQRIALISVFCLTMTVAAKPAANTDLGFAGMEIYRFEDGTSCLHTYDLNGDGMDDIIFVNNKASRLEVLLRARAEPPADSGRIPILEDVFSNRGVVVDQKIIACYTAEPAGVGKPAIFTLGRELGLHEYPFEDGRLLPGRKIFLKSPERLMDFKIGDLDGDGSPELVICRKDNLEILWNDGAGNFNRRTEIPINPSDAFKFELADFTGNGQTDLLIFMANDPTMPRLRAGIGDGQFAPECIMQIAPTHSSRSLRINPERRCHIGCILKSRRGMRVYTVEQEANPDFLAQAEFLPARIPLLGLNPRLPPAWVAHDFDNDQRIDCCVAAPELGQIHIYPGTHTGLAAQPSCFDSLSGISTVSLTHDGNLLVFSPAEKTAALHTKNQLDKFPRLIEPPGPEPVLAAAHPSRPGVIWICRDPVTRAATLTERPIEEDPTATPPFDFPIELQNDPDTIRIFPMADGGTGIMLFIPYQPPVFHMITATGSLTTVSAASFNASAVSLKPAMVDFNGQNSLLVALTKLAREFNWQNDGWQPHRQFTPATANAGISAAAYFQKDSTDLGVVLFDQNSNDLLWFGPDAGTPNRTHIGMPISTPAGITALRSEDGKYDAGLLMVMEQELLVFYNAPTYKFKNLADYASPAEEASLSLIRDIAPGNPPRPMIALTDSHNRAVELVGMFDGQLAEQLIFEVFQDPGFASARGGAEPHDAASGDINGNGIGDLAILTHDKLIIYLGE